MARERQSKKDQRLQKNSGENRPASNVIPFHPKMDTKELPVRSTWTVEVKENHLPVKITQVSSGFGRVRAMMNGEAMVLAS
ncbi:hypothetical protein [Thermoflavimicrobium dichotomicum]|uniref:Uncharacterized protein n=1 Tax=Thermoflavimicrobium dichotomicum TaxID=46223 RepID=A0A1I3RY43_9BACL|nr:hypothetical protein [Thermoflavimicrobium dichotomicum]SFJ50950.1 hypothetical protein SAMN05421852_11167 [Thermoflavimicrobium dichotomicum]